MLRMKRRNGTALRAVFLAGLKLRPSRGAGMRRNLVQWRRSTPHPIQNIHRDVDKDQARSERSGRDSEQRENEYES